MKMRKLVAAVLAVLMLCSIIPFTAVAADNSATIDFTDKANRTAYSTEQQVWEQNGIVVTNDKGASVSNVGDYGGEGYPARFYKSSTVKIEYPGMTQIVIDCTGLDAKYVNGWSDSFSANATATVDGSIVTIVLAEPADSFVWETMSAQSRANNITVYGEGGVPVVPPVTPDEPEEPDTPDVPDEPEEPVVPTDSAVLDLTDKVNRVSYSSSQQVWQQNGIVVTNDKGASTSNVGDYANPGRFYKSSTVTLEYPGMTKIVIDSVTYADNDYAIGWTDSFSADATATVVDGDVTIVLAEPADSFVWEKLTAQSRAYTITVYTGDAGDAPVVPPVEPDVPDQPDTPDVPDAPIGSLGVVVNPVAGVAYKFGMIQENVSASDVYYLKGGMNGYYMDTAADASAAIDVYLEETAGGYYLYTLVGGSKTYINMVVSGTHVNGAYEAAASTVYTYDAEAKTVIADVDGTPYWFGTRNDKTYTTVGPCAVSYAGFYCQFYGAAEGGETPDVPDIPDVPDVPDVPVDPPVSDEIETDYPFLFGMTQYNVSEEDVYFLAGGMDGYYMATTTNVEEAIVVYVEATDGGYYFYTYDGDTKLYINMVVSGTHVNGAYEAKASTVYRYDAERSTLIANVDGYDYWFGTRNDKTYTTVGPCKTEYEGFYCEFYYFSEEDECDHEYDNDCDADCNLCGEWREVGDHQYDNAYDADCNLCGYVRDLPIVGGTIGVVQNSAHAGENVNLAVQVDGNPGIVSAKVKVYFDTTLLEFVSAVAGDFSADGYSWSDFEVANEKGYIIVNWCDAIHPNSMANLLATLTFKVKADAPAGFANVWVEFSCEDDIYNYDDQTVYFEALGGGVEILASADVLPGDVNGDGKVNNRDLGVMQKYLNELNLDGQVFDEAAADVNGDGKINNRDLGALQILLNV